MVIIEGYLAAVEMALLTAIPILAVLTLYSWFLAYRARPYRVPLVLAISNTIIGACGTWLGWTVLYRGRIGPVPDEFLPITATSVLIVIVVSFATTVYLAWLEARRLK